MLTPIRVCVLLAVVFGTRLFGAELAVTVKDQDYLNARGFSVFLYDNTYHPVFVGQSEGVKL